MKILAGTDPRLPLRDVAAHAERVERLGYDGLHIAEMLHDPHVAAALALAATSVLEVRTAVALAFVRSPMATALSAWDLAHLSRGRFDLGLGTQIRSNIEARYGAEFDRPVGRMADYMAAVRACFEAFESGEHLRHNGPFYGLTRLQPDFRPEPLGSNRRPEIWLGAVGPQMIALAGSAADGLVTHPTNSHPADLRDRLVPALGAAAARAGRPRPPLVVLPLVATGPDRAAVTEARAAARKRLSFLYSTPAYAPTLVLLDREDLGVQLRSLIRDEEWDRLESVLDDDLLDQVVPSGTWTEIVEVLEEWYAGSVDGILFRPPSDAANDGDLRNVIAALKEI
jgi:probable F420-dependent oxidoreductase